MPRLSLGLKFVTLTALAGFMALGGSVLPRYDGRLPFSCSLDPVREFIDDPFGIQAHRARTVCSANLKQVSLDTSIVLAGPSDQGGAEEEFHPGLVATYHDSDRPMSVQVTRLEPTLALALGTGEAAHPRLTADGGTVRWEGTLNVLRAGNYRFQARVRGRFRLALDGKEVLAVEGKEAAPVVQETGDVRLEAGAHPLRAEFTRLPGTARLEVSWQSPFFRREPIPYDVLGHLPKQVTKRLEDDALAERGRLLAEEHNCTSCHRPADRDRLAQGLLKRPGPDLSQVGHRAHPGWIYRWLEAPEKLRPGAGMPRLFDDSDAGRVERYAVARYLASLGGPVPQQPRRDSREVRASRARGQALFTSTGCIACHQEQKEAETAGPSFYGLGPAAQVHAGYPLTGLGSKTTFDRLAAYLSNPLAIDPSGRMPDMRLQGREAEDLAHYLCASEDATVHRDLPAPPKPEDVLAAFRRLEPRAGELAAFQHQPADAQVTDLGKRLVTTKGCANCHTVAPGGKALSTVSAAASFDDLKKPDRQEAGCLAKDAGRRGHAPGFAFSDRDRKALRLFLTEGTRGVGSPAPTHAARVALTRFNCLACHSRDGEGGLTPSLVEELRRYEKAENAEAVSPPPLTGVGHKLRTPWLRQVLTGAGRARPWMALRMPQFGEPQVGRLPEVLAALEGAEPANDVHKVPLTSAKIEAGRHLVGKGAFGCISCHDLARIPNSGTRGPDLAFMDQRVRYDWYRRWLEQAQRMSPGTRMPSVFSDGKSPVTNVLGGSADAQAEAMWAYLSLGPGLPLPDGLEPPKGLVLAVKDRPVLLRTFMPDANPRSVAVGYPGGVSTAFDATTCRLGYAWSGNFLDVGPVWNDRGGSPAHVLGDRFWRAPAGCPWGLSASQEPPDFAARANDPAYGAHVPEGKLYTGPHQLHFEGYGIDEKGAPTFRYQVQAADAHPLEVAERPGALRSAAGVGVARHFTVKVPAGQTAWLFAGETTGQPRLLDAAGTVLPLDVGRGEVEVPSSGRFVVLPQDGGRVLVLGVRSAPDGSRWQLRHLGDHRQALLRLPASGAEVHVDLNLWVPYRDEPGLLKDLLSAK